MDLSAHTFAPVEVETLATWERQRSQDELFSHLGRFSTRLAEVSAQSEEDDELEGLFDLTTV